MPLKISQKFLIAVSVPVIFELVLAGVLLQLLSLADQARKKEQTARELANHSYALMGLHAARVTQMALYKATKDPAVLTEMLRTQDRARAEVARIHQLVRDTAVNSAGWNRLDELARIIHEEHAAVAAKVNAGDRDGAGLEFISLRKHFEELLGATEALTAEQAADSSGTAQKLEEYSDAIRGVLYVSLVLSVLIAFGLVIVFNRSTARRLGVILANTERLAAGQAPTGELQGRDEIAKIDRQFHRMYRSLEALRRRERAILENVAEVIASIDTNWRFTDINDAALTHWGFDKEQLVGRRVVEIVCQQERDGVLTELRRVMATGSGRLECGIETISGQLAETEWSLNWSVADNMIYCVIHDISARKSLERMKAEFVAMLSHEIRTPLASIQMTHSLLDAELGETQVIDPFLRKSLAGAQDNVNRLMALINNLLDLDKLESGFSDFVPELKSAGEIIETAVGAIEPLFMRRGIEPRVVIEESLAVVCDKERLVQVLINLMSNAIKYSQPQSTITINAKKEGSQVRFSVADRGRGIPEDKLATIFEPYRQVSGSDERVHKGVGLGLAICKAIIDMHQGRIGVDSVSGRGSTFWFTVPAATISDSAKLDFPNSDSPKSNSPKSHLPN